MSGVIQVSVRAEESSDCWTVKAENEVSLAGSRMAVPEAPLRQGVGSGRDI